MARLPVTGSDENVWGDVLNDFLKQEHNEDGTLKIRDEGSFVSDATNSVKGKIRLAGDIGGTADVPTVPALGTKLSLTGGSMQGNLIMNANLLLATGALIRGFIDSVTSTDFYPVFTQGGEVGWSLNQLRLRGGRFDFDALDGKAEIRLHGRPQFNMYDTDSGNIMLRIDNTRKVFLYNDLQVGENNGQQGRLLIAGRIGGNSPDPDSMNVQVTDTRDMVTGVGGGIGFVGKFTDTGLTAGFASLRATKSNATSGSLAANLVFATRSNGGDVADRMWLDDRGNLGIGTAEPHSKIHVNGSVATAIITVTGNYTVSIIDATILANAIANSLQLILPSAIGIAGRIYTLKKVDVSGNPVSVVASEGQTIDGQTTYILNVQWQYVTVQSDGARWVVIGDGQ